MTETVRLLDRSDEKRVWQLLEAHPIRNCFAISRLAVGGMNPVDLGGCMWGYGTAERLSAALLVGANLVPINTDAAARSAFADYAKRQGRRSSSMVGPADEVMDLWHRFESLWGPARDVRPRQPLMVATEPASVDADQEVRATTLDDLELLMPACVAMFTEEVGVSPLAGGSGPGYRRRVRELVQQRRSFARFHEGELVFKAEIGALTSHASQIQGVWVAPAFRGQGLAAAGMAAVVEFSRELAPEVSLYVNSYNLPAMAAYHRAGFRTREQFATVLF